MHFIVWNKFYRQQFSSNISSIEIFMQLNTFLFFLATEGTTYTQQSYKVSDVFPFKWINKKWKEGFSVTSMTTAGSRWGIAMSRDAGYSNQVILVQFFLLFFFLILLLFPLYNNFVNLHAKSFTSRPQTFARASRWLSLIFFTLVKGSIEDGKVDIELPRLLRQLTKLLSF